MKFAEAFVLLALIVTGGAIVIAWLNYSKQRGPPPEESQRNAQEAVQQAEEIVQRPKEDQNKQKGKP